MASIDGEPDEEQLETMLLEARHQGVWLVYLLVSERRDLDARLLREFGGEWVGGHVTYTRTLDDSEPPEDPADPPLEVYSGPSDDPQLLRLGVEAGGLSRFRVDTRLPADRCDAMYEAWASKSATGELADEVLVVRSDRHLAGLLTFQVRSGHAEIGLVGVDANCRGRGFASRLLDFAHRRMLLRGAVHATVVTQAQNESARNLYSKAGYTRKSEGRYFHFMPQTLREQIQ